MNGTNKWQETEDAIVNSIKSGNNQCGTLAKAMASGADGLDTFIRSMVRPALMIRAAEDNHKDREIAALSRDNENKRFALEIVAANILEIPPLVKAAMEKALPGRTL